MVSLFFMELVHFGVQLGLSIDIFMNGSTRQRADEWLGMGDKVIVSVLVFFLAFNVMSMFLLGQLIMLHMKLQRQTLTTYEFIVVDSKRKRELAKLKGDLERQRIHEIDYARRNGHRFRVFRLKCGGFCRDTLHCAILDPLDMPKPYEPDPEAGFGAVLGANNANGFTINNINEQASKERTTTDNTSDTTKNYKDIDKQTDTTTAIDDNRTHSSHNVTLALTSTATIPQSGSNTSSSSPLHSPNGGDETCFSESGVRGHAEPVVRLSPLPLSLQSPLEHQPPPPPMASASSKSFDNSDDGGDDVDEANDQTLMAAASISELHFQ
jgi:hypothetical protein